MLVRDPSRAPVERRDSHEKRPTLRVVPQLDPEIVQKSDGIEGVVEMTSTSAMVTKDPPVFEACNRVLDSGPSLAMSAPFRIADDPVLAKHGRL